ncbi:MAG TPA: GntR family transcriptional regulator, partial [Propionicimonas sp.]
MRASERVYGALRDEIVAWRLAPGSELSEVEQAERWGVSRTPVREALGRLTSDGLAVLGKGRTLVVSDL